MGIYEGIIAEAVERNVKKDYQAQKKNCLDERVPDERRVSCGRDNIYNPLVEKRGDDASPHNSETVRKKDEQAALFVSLKVRPVVFDYKLKVHVDRMGFEPTTSTMP